MRTLLAAITLSLLLTACPKPGPRPPVTISGVMDCASDQFKRDWPSLVPAVGSCLSGEGFLDCLDALPNLLETTIDIVACVVANRGDNAAAQASKNTQDTLSRMQAERAQAWLHARGYAQ